MRHAKLISYADHNNPWSQAVVEYFSILCNIRNMDWEVTVMDNKKKKKQQVTKSIDEQGILLSLSFLRDVFKCITHIILYSLRWEGRRRPWETQKLPLSEQTLSAKGFHPRRQRRRAVPRVPSFAPCPSPAERETASNARILTCRLGYVACTADPCAQVIHISEVPYAFPKQTQLRFPDLRSCEKSGHTHEGHGVPAPENTS